MQALWQVSGSRPTQENKEPCALTTYVDPSGILPVLYLPGIVLLSKVSRQRKF